ncbi:Crp/Fnr family transcriptional regulator [Spirochaetota bacterium]
MNQQAPVQLAIANFGPGSYIMVEGKRESDYFFIVRQGQVRTTRETALTEEDSNIVLKPGDFFGVIEAMTGHPRIESAIALTQASMIAVKKGQFGFLIQKNTPLAIKIIRSFSQKLRYYDHELAKRTLKTTQQEGDPENLFFIGEYYFKQSNFKIARYVFSRYLALNPQGMKMKESKERIIEMGQAEETPPQPQTGFNRMCKDGEMLFCENEPGEELYIIQTGKIKITKIVNDQEILIAVLNPGDIFGDMALLENKPRNASAIAFGDCQMMAVNKVNFEKVVIQNPALSTKLIELLSERVWTVYRQLGNLLLEKPVARLYDSLLLQLQKAHVRIERKQAYAFSFGADELVKMIGMSDAEGKDTIQELLKNKLMSIRNNKIYCEDVEDIDKQVQYFKKMQVLEAKRQASKFNR